MISILYRCACFGLLHKFKNSIVLDNETHYTEIIMPIFNKTKQFHCNFVGLSETSSLYCCCFVRATVLSTVRSELSSEHHVLKRRQFICETSVRFLDSFQFRTLYLFNVAVLGSNLAAGWTMWDRYSIPINDRSSPHFSYHTDSLAQFRLLPNDNQESSITDKAART
jgi:hypothetical protein